MTRKLRSSWSMESMQELMDIHGVNTNQLDILDLLAANLRFEIDTAPVFDRLIIAHKFKCRRNVYVRTKVKCITPVVTQQSRRLG
jgi:hypothetical protein